MEPASLSPPLDFTVTREVWNAYELIDHSILKVKIVLTRVSKVQTEETDEPPSTKYDFDFQFIHVVLTRERGQPDVRTYSPEEFQTSILRLDIRYVTQSQEWNEYVVDDGARIRVQPAVLRVDKTNKFDVKGYPIYLVQVNAMVDVRPPNAVRSP